MAFPETEPAEAVDGHVRPLLTWNVNAKRARSKAPVERAAVPSGR